MDFEGLAKTYWELVRKSKNPAKELVTFYQVSLNTSGNGKLSRFMQQQIKLFGRDLVFFTILDIAGYDNLRDKENPQPLMRYILKQKLKEGRNKDGGRSKSPNLDSFVEEIKKKKEELKNSD